MKVYVPRYSGFCPGVKIAEKKILELKRKSSGRRIQILGELIHNREYIRRLGDLGIETAEKPEELCPSSIAVIRTHGMDLGIEKQLRKTMEVADLTCVKVKRLQELILSYSQRGYFTLITGKRDHPEVLGLVSYASAHFVAETDGDIDSFIERCQKEPGKFRKILVISQTTGNRSFFERTSEKIKRAFTEDQEIIIEDSICSITTLREEEASVLQKKAGITFVVGDRTSANANKIYDILKGNDPSTYFIENLGELLAIGLDLSNAGSALVVSSSSTPDFVEREVVEYLDKQ